jgi:hypothetical protein
MADDAISEEGRRAAFEQWEKLGLDQIRADLQNGIWRVVGGTQAVRELAWEWVRLKEAEQAAASSPQKTAEILTLKPGVWGMNVDLKEAARRVVKWWQGKDGTEP